MGKNKSPKNEGKKQRKKQDELIFLENDFSNLIKIPCNMKLENFVKIITDNGLYAIRNSQFNHRYLIIIHRKVYANYKR